jgi:DNA-binding response OmpR family regulator
MIEGKILVVDDDEGIRSLLANVFGSAGYQVQTAGNAEEALKIMRAAPANLLFLDLKLPGLNGVELCREIRKGWPWTVAIAMTGYASLFELVDCREAGFEDYFIKPMSMATLLEVAAQAFQKIERWKQR